MSSAVAAPRETGAETGRAKRCYGGVVKPRRNVTHYLVILMTYPELILRFSFIDLLLGMSTNAL